VGRCPPRAASPGGGASQRPGETWTTEHAPAAVKTV